MRVPDAENAEVDIRKPVDYLLNPHHATGKHKAILWSAALGIKTDHADELSTALIETVKFSEAKVGKFDRHGQRYTVDFLLEWHGKSAIIRTGWIIEHGSRIPRLTTAFPR